MKKIYFLFFLFIIPLVSATAELRFMGTENAVFGQETSCDYPHSFFFNNTGENQTYFYNKFCYIETPVLQIPPFRYFINATIIFNGTPTPIVTSPVQNGTYNVSFSYNTTGLIAYWNYSFNNLSTPVLTTGASYHSPTYTFSNAGNNAQGELLIFNYTSGTWKRLEFCISSCTMNGKETFDIDPFAYSDYRNAQNITSIKIDFEAGSTVNLQNLSTFNWTEGTNPVDAYVGNVTFYLNNDQSNFVNVTLSPSVFTSGFQIDITNKLISLYPVGSPVQTDIPFTMQADYFGYANISYINIIYEPVPTGGSAAGSLSELSRVFFGGGTIRDVLLSYNPSAYLELEKDFFVWLDGGDVDSFVNNGWKTFSSLVRYLFRQPASIAGGVK